MSSFLYRYVHVWIQYVSPLSISDIEYDMFPFLTIGDMKRASAAGKLRWEIKLKLTEWECNRFFYKQLYSLGQLNITSVGE